MIRNIIFDIGGVLVYPRLGEWNIPYGAKRILGSRADGIGSEKYRAAYAKAVPFLDESRPVKDVEQEYKLREAFIRSLDEDMQWRMTEEEIADLAHDFTYNIDRYGFFDDIKPYLESWKQKYRLGLLSDALPSILLFLEQYGISGMFDGKVISAHVGAVKPDPRIYDAALRSLNAEPGECVFIDDRPGNLEGARKAGIRGIQMARSEFMPDQIWDGPVAHDFRELNTILESGEFL